MTNSIIICFYGSSDYELRQSLAVQYNTEIDTIINKILATKINSLKIITGGYGGIMDLIAENFQRKKKSFPNKNIEIIGITCDAYEFENPYAKTYNPCNDYSKHNDVIIQAKNFADRIQAMIELSDLFIVLPGSQGSLGELLLTYDSYANSKYILDHKKAEIYIHEYWKPLLTNEISNQSQLNTYFRDFSSDVLKYVNVETFEQLLSTVASKQKNYNAEEIPDNILGKVSGINENDYIQNKFHRLKDSINKAIIGRLYDEVDYKILERLQKSKDFPILGLDFGWFRTSKEKPQSGKYYTFSTDDYLKLTIEFFKNRNSIMLNVNEYIKEFKNAFLDGNCQTQVNISFREEESIPEKSPVKEDGSFEELKAHFEKYKYGQTLIWKGFKITQNSLTIKQQEEKANEIIFSVFLLLNHRVPTRKIENIHQLIDDFLLAVSSTKAGELFQEKEVEILKQATRAAISQVMARNMSHNIGSHVMNKLVSEDYLEKFCSYAYCLKSYKPNSDIKEKKDHTAFRQLAIYNNYVKTRMDYLADITFGTPVMLNTKNAYRDTFLELDKVRLLLDNISARGDKFKFKIHFVNGDNKPLGESNDIPLAIPNDVLGCQAFYNIIENIIRNTAKHGKTEIDETSVFTIKIREITEDEVMEASKELKLEAQTLYCVEIYDDIKVDDSVIKGQNEKLNKKILNDSNELRSESLGMIEMDASAAYLRQLDIVYINSDEYDVDDYDKIYNKGNKFNILKAFAGKNTEGENTLGYRFFVKKPQLALIISDIEVNDNDKKDLAKIGITVLRNQEFTENLNDNIIFNHEFLVLDECFKGNLKNVVDTKSTSLPHRVFWKEKNCIDSLLINKDELEFKLWSMREAELIISYLATTKLQLNETSKALSIGSFFGCCYESHLDSLLEIADDKIDEVWGNKINDKFYYEALSSKGQSQLPKIYKIEGKEKVVVDFKKDSYLAAISQNEENRVAKVKVAESMLARIIVIDERIQEILDEKLYKIPYSEHYRMSNIYVPQKEITFQENDTEVKYDIELKGDLINIEMINKYIEHTIQPANNNIPIAFNPKYDFILIHYSLLERAYKDGKDGKTREQCIDEWLKKYKDKASIVVTSGRSNVKGLPQHVSFVNLSAVTTALKEIKSKYLLHQIVYSSRKLKN